MGHLATLETLLSGAVFAIPAAVFVTLVILLLRRSRRNAKAGTQRGNSAVRAYALADGPEEPAPVKPQLSADEIRQRIEAALSDGNKTALAGLYLDLARGHEKLGQADARMSALRSAAGCGALHGPRTAHAAARLELAEVAYAAGDLTSACEQWQLARTSYLEEGNMDEHGRIEKRMRDNGCPTDWVLTDF